VQPGGGYNLSAAPIPTSYISATSARLPPCPPPGPLCWQLPMHWLAHSADCPFIKQPMKLGEAGGTSASQAMTLTAASCTLGCYVHSSMLQVWLLVASTHSTASSLSAFQGASARQQPPVTTTWPLPDWTRPCSTPGRQPIQALHRPRACLGPPR
jgi:hypothetical protein